MKTLGIDPGTICTGWSLFNDDEISGCGKYHFKSTWLQSKRLGELMWSINTTIEEYNPDVLIVEDQFVRSNNKRTPLVTARAKGIVIASAAMHNIKVVEYSPMEIKKAVTGKGNATKEEVYHSLCNILPNKTLKNIGEFNDKGKNKNDDIYDSIAINIAYKKIGEEDLITIKKGKQHIKHRII